MKIKVTKLFIENPQTYKEKKNMKKQKIWRALLAVGKLEQ